MQIRRAHQSEASALTSIALASKAHWQYTPAQLAAWRDDLFISPDAVSANPTYVAIVDSAIVGFFQIEPSSPHWTLDHLWVLPSAMGGGVGQALLSCAVDVAAVNGAAAIAIDADPNSEPFYLACGAQRIGVVAAPIEGAPQRVRPQLLLAAAQAKPWLDAERVRQAGRGRETSALPVRKNKTIKLVAGIAASFTGLVGAILFLLQARIVGFEVAMLMLVALIALYLGLGFLVVVYRFVARLE